MARLTSEEMLRAGEAVQARRAELGLTQIELTEKAHVGKDRVGVLERGEEWPQPRNERAIEEALAWEPGALRRIARGGSPAEEDTRPADTSGQRAATPYVGYGAEVWAALDGLMDDEDRHLVVQVALGQRARREHAS